MARFTRLSMALISTFAVAAPSFAADTGMLYVKSFPSGATVVIEGTVRGKTPVLVKGLPAGDVTVEFRIAGVKPVTKQATVKANKVVTIDVAIEVPRATLTIVSEPLEATVILDGRDAGKTPLTLEGLDPGEHSLILLKDGHPRTARSVVLEPGSERVLEVKLGTAGGDETKRPPAGEPVVQAAKSVPVEVQLILTMLKDAVAKGDYAETRRNLALALKQPDMAESKEELCAAIRVVQAFETRQRHVRKGAEALVGKEVTLRTKTGSRKGKVEGVSFEGITIASRIIIDGQAAGETRGTIAWSALAPEEQDRLAGSWEPEGLDGAVARAILAQARKDRAAAARALAAAGEHPLGKYLAAGSAAAGPAEDDPNEAWAALEKRCSAKRITAAEEMALDREICAFKDRHGKAGLDPALRRRIRLAADRAKRASGLVGHWTFDEGGGSVARDWSGRGHHGRIQGGARWMKGKIGAALGFDGRNDKVDVPYSAALNPAQFSLALWAKPTHGAGTYRSPLTCRDVLPGRGYLLYARSNNKWSAFIGDGRAVRNPWVQLDGPAVVLNAWTHLACTYDGTTMRMYVNGADIGTTMTGRLSQNRARPLRIGAGCSELSGKYFFPGLIDDVRIYNRALSAEEVKALAIQAE